LSTVVMNRRAIAKLEVELTKYVERSRPKGWDSSVCQLPVGNGIWNR
jgi:hypothetical protein